MEIKKKKPNFLRRTWYKYSKLGKGRKKKQVWRRPTGRDNKMREQRKGKPVIVSIGYSADKNERGKIDGKIPVIILNVADLQKMGKTNIGIVGNIGKKKKLEIAKIAEEKKIELYNMNTKTYTKKNEKIKKDKKAEVKESKIKPTKEEKKWTYELKKN